MIPDQWYAILESREVKRNHPVGITRMGEKMVAWRDHNGSVVIQSDLCPHRGAALSAGKIMGDALQCPFHGFEYDPSGQCVLIPANGKNAPVPKTFKVKSYIVREQNGYVFIWWGREQETYPPLPEFNDLDSSFSTSEDHAHWSVDYSRAIENQLDVFHLPFPHRTTIGRGNRTIADGPLVTLVDDKMDIWVYNRIDDGSIARRSGELETPDRPPFLRFIFPNLWMNRISNDVRITVYFTPIDAENCMMYLRYYLRGPKPPWIANFAVWGMKIFSKIILNQDKRVVITQRPLKTGLQIGEKLIPADQPIILYRRHRKELQEKANSTP